MTSQTKVAVLYYSSTGSIHEMAKAVVTGSEKAGAEVRLRRIPESAPSEAIASNPAWAAHVEATRDVPEADLDDLVWADAVILGSPTRFGLPAAQIKQFIDRTGPLWYQGKLAGKVYSSFTSTSTRHGGLESTILALNNTFYHWGGFIVPPGYTDPVQFVTGNPYGASHVAKDGAMPGDDELAASEYLGRRVAEVAGRLVATDEAA
jgi:NAD(P)H dehydrogenase (quinone)